MRATTARTLRSIIAGEAVRRLLVEAAGVPDPGVVHEQVDLDAGRVERRRCELGVRALAGEIEGHGRHRRFRPELRRERLQAVGAARHEHEATAAGGAARARTLPRSRWRRR